MSSDTPISAPSSKRKYIFLVAAIAIVVAGWTGAWFFGRSVLADQLKQAFRQLSEQGTDVACADLKIGGFPFRYEVYCSNLQSADQSGTQFDLQGLNTVALVYNPFHVIAEARSPAAIALPMNGTTGLITWDTARASVKYSLSALGNVDLVLERPEIDFQSTFVVGLVAAEKTELHLRKAPDEAGAVDTYVSIDKITTNAIPSLNDPIDTRVHVRIENGEPLLSGKDIRLLLQETGGELPLRLELAEISLKASRLGARGDLKLNAAGTLSGMLTMTMVQPQDFLDAIRPFFPPDSNEFSILQSLMTSLKATGKDHRGDPAVEIPVILDHGLIRIGFVTLGRIPPLFQAGS